jgi:hypothetical protein
MSYFRYLSADWISAMSAAVKADTALSALASQHTVGLTQVVTGTPFGDVTYHLHVRDGNVSFAPGAAPAEDVRFTETYETAVGIATEKINAQEAFIKGLIVFSGDHQKLIDAGDVFAALNPVFDAVRAVTEFI